MQSDWDGRSAARALNRHSTQAWLQSAQNVAKIIRRVRSQCLTSLVLAGQWPKDPPWPGEERPHLMRVMLVANIDPANRFANGATGRLLSWEPAASRGHKAVPANDEHVCAKFGHESAAAKRVRLPRTCLLYTSPSPRD